MSKKPRLDGSESDPIYEPGKSSQIPASHLKSMDEYKKLYQKSIEEPTQFWDEMANKLITWDKKYHTVLSGGLQEGNMAWFLGGQLNVSYNCIDRHALQDPNKTAIIWESDEPGNSKKISYGILLNEVCRLSNVLKSFGVGKGDCVAIYMPMVPEAAYAMLACARVGAVHSVVFAGFSAESLRDRINDAKCKFLITADQGRRGGKSINLKKISDDALTDCPCIKDVLVFKRTGDLDISMHEPRDKWWHEEMDKQRPYFPPVPMDSEDPLFLLYTSGSTGKPKGLLHTQAGYLLGTTLSLRYAFDLHPELNDVYACVADVGWITGHSYIVYGPLSNGATTVMFESIPTYPNPDRYWRMIDEHKITHFYTAPTAIRALKRLGDDWVKKYDLSSLRMLGTVGEPINPEAWEWYYRVVGRQMCSIVDTYWQTETGSFVIAPYSTITPTKPGSAAYPQLGMKVAILDASTGKELNGTSVEGVLCIAKPWPSMARTVYNNHSRFMSTYLNVYKGYYFTGDGAGRDADGYYWIKGRVDDVINVSGHRLSTAEIESALVLHPECSEAAVIGANDELTGQAVVAFCCLKHHDEVQIASDQDSLRKQLVNQVRKHIGPFASPKRVLIVQDLPKTRSGKIMRRILRKLLTAYQSKAASAAQDDQLGDLSTLANPSCIDQLRLVLQREYQ